MGRRAAMKARGQAMRSARADQDGAVMSGLLGGATLEDVAAGYGITHQAISRRMQRIARGHGLSVPGLRAAIDQVHAAERDERAAVYARNDGRLPVMLGKPGGGPRMTDAELVQRDLDAWKDRYCVAGLEERERMADEGVALFDRLVKAEGY